MEEFRTGDKVLIHKNASVKSNTDRKFHYMWFGPFEVMRMVGTQSVEIKRSESSGKDITCLMLGLSRDLLTPILDFTGPLTIPWKSYVRILDKYRKL